MFCSPQHLDEVNKQMRLMEGDLQRVEDRLSKHRIAYNSAAMSVSQPSVVKCWVEDGFQ